MRKNFCDACEKEIKSHLNVLKIPYHIVEQRRGYLDQDMIEVSGRSVDIEVCNACWNVAWRAAFAALKSIETSKK